MKRIFRLFVDSLSDIFNMRDDESKGRVIALTCTLLATFYNVFITGIFYTGFLSMYGMSITDAGVLTFVPYIANLFSIFSPKLLSKFKRRKWLLLGSKLIYYFLFIVVTTVMPQFVQDADARLWLFVAVIALATGFFAFFGSGFTIWFYNFYPERTEPRTRYLMYHQIFGSILSSLILIGSGFLTDALSNSPFQDQLILIFRYLAFGLVVLELIIQSRAKEYPYEETENVRLSDVFTLPFKHRKFLFCMLLMFFWNYIANLNNGLWAYHLLNHLDMTYTVINTLSVLYTVFLLVLSPFWKKVLTRFSWVKTFGIAILITVPTEVAYFCMTAESTWMYIPVGMVQHVANVGVNLAYANILYMNLPKENSTAYITFNTIGCNILAFLGMMTGTLVSAISEDTSFMFLGLEVYSVQFTTLLRGLTIAILGTWLVLRWRDFTPDDAIKEVEELEELRKATHMPLRFKLRLIWMRLTRKRT